jgi:hypothetical protein
MTSISKIKTYDIIWPRFPSNLICKSPTLRRRRGDSQVLSTLIQSRPKVWTGGTSETPWETSQGRGGDDFFSKGSCWEDEAIRVQTMSVTLWTSFWGENEAHFIPWKSFWGEPFNVLIPTLLWISGSWNIPWMWATQCHTPSMTMVGKPDIKTVMRDGLWHWVYHITEYLRLAMSSWLVYQPRIWGDFDHYGQFSRETLPPKWWFICLRFFYNLTRWLGNQQTFAHFIEEQPHGVSLAWVDLGKWVVNGVSKKASNIEA